MRIEKNAPPQGVTYRVNGQTPLASAKAAALPDGGRSINAAALNVPGAGKGTEPPKDEYIPSFPQPSARGEDPARNEKPAPGEESQNPAPGETAEAEGQAEEERKDGELTPEEEQVVAELKITDQEVRAHEQAHISAGGSYILGGATFEYEKGPDQRRYAVGGEVSIDSSPIRDNPEATIAKMQVVRAAALAPAEPSAQDRAVASSASREEGQARAELGEKRAAEARESAEKRAQDAQDRQNKTDGETQPQSRIRADAAAAYAKPFDTQASQAIINFAA